MERKREDDVEIREFNAIEMEVCSIVIWGLIISSLLLGYLLSSSVCRPFIVISSMLSTLYPFV